MNRIKEARHSKKLSQDELGDLIHVARQTISTYEKGTREPTLETLADIARVLEVSSDYLLGLTDYPAPIYGLTPKELETIHALRCVDKRALELFDVLLQDQLSYATERPVRLTSRSASSPKPSTSDTH